MSYLPKTPTSNYPSSPRSTPAPNHSLSPPTQLFVLSKPQEAQTSILTKRFSSKATDFLTRKQSKAKSSTTTSIQQLKPQSQRRSSLVKFSPTTPPESSFNFWESSSSEFRSYPSSKSMIPRSEEVLFPTIPSATTIKDPRSPSTFPQSTYPGLFPPSPESSEEDTSVSEGTDEEAEGLRSHSSLKKDQLNPERRRSSASTAVPSSHHRHRHTPSQGFSQQQKSLLTPWEMQDDDFSSSLSPEDTRDRNRQQELEMQRAAGENGWKSHSKDPIKRYSDQSLRLDLEGLDLGVRPEEEISSTLSPVASLVSPTSIPKDRYSQSGWQGVPSTYDPSSSTSSSRPHPKSKRSNFETQLSQVSSPPRSSMSSLLDRSPARLNVPTANQDKRTQDVDSFTAHLREQCVDSREIMGMGEESMKRSQVGEGSNHQEGRGISASTASPTMPSRSQFLSKLPSSDAESHPQLLGGFASLGIAPWAGVLAHPNKDFASSNSPSGESATGTTSRSGSRPATPSLSSADYIGPSASSWPGVGLGLSSNTSASNLGNTTEGDTSMSTPSCWGKLLASNRDPMEMFEIISIDEMGQHSIDVGSAEDWEGWSLAVEQDLKQKETEDEEDSEEKKEDLTSAGRRAGWEVARSMKRQRKWIVAPSLELSSDDSSWQDESAALDSSLMFPVPPSSSSSSSSINVTAISAARAALRTIVVSDHPSSRRDTDAAPSPFSGKANFELRFLKAGHGSPNQTFVLSSPQIHRSSVDSRSGRMSSSNSSPSISTSGSPFFNSTADQLDRQLAAARASAQLDQRRDTVVPTAEKIRQIRKTRSRPALRGPASNRPDDFAPSLPGGPNDRGLSDGVTWPSARRGSDLPPAVAAQMQLRSSSPLIADTESRRPSLGKSNSHESLGVTTPKPVTTAALVSAGVKGNRQSLPPRRLFLETEGLKSHLSREDLLSQAPSSHLVANSAVDQSPMSLPAPSSFSGYSIPRAFPSEVKSPFEDYTLFMDPPKRQTSGSEFTEPSPRSSIQVASLGQVDPLDSSSSSSHLPVDWSLDSAKFSSLSRAETTPAGFERTREVKPSSSSGSGMQLSSSPSTNISSRSKAAPVSKDVNGTSQLTSKRDKRLSDWFKKKVSKDPPAFGVGSPSSRGKSTTTSPSVESDEAGHGAFQSPFAYSISMLDADADTAEFLRSPNENHHSRMGASNPLDRFSRRPDTAPESPSGSVETFQAAELQRAQLRDPHFNLNLKQSQSRISNSRVGEGYDRRLDEEILRANGKKERLPLGDSHSGIKNEGSKTSRRRSVKRSLNEDEKAVLTSIGKLHGWPESEISGLAPKAKSSKPSSSRASKASIVASIDASRAQLQQQVSRSRKISQQPTDSFNLDPSLLGLEGVPNQALTMLLPLPLFPSFSTTSESSEKEKNHKSLRYLRVSFIPFAAAAPSPSVAGSSSSPTTDASSFNPETPASSSHSHPQLWHAHSSSPSPHSFGLMKKFALAARELSSSSSSLGGANPNSHSSHHSGDQATPRKAKYGDRINSNLEWDRCRLPSRRKSCIEAFRITALVLDSPFSTNETQSSSLPAPSSFPIVLGMCDCERGLELVPEGWEALNLADGPASTALIGEETNSNLDPMAGIADIIIAASVAVMDL